MSDVIGTLNQLINDVVLRAQLYGISYAEAYFDEMNDILTDNGDVQQLVFSEFTGMDQSQKKIRADGYSYENDDSKSVSQLREITIVATDYGYDGTSENINDVTTFNTSDLDKKFLEMKRFVLECSGPQLLNSIEPSSKYSGLVRSLTENFTKLEKITLLYITTSKFTGRIKDFEPEVIQGIKINRRLYDIQRHHAIITSKDGSEPTQISFDEFGHAALTALKTSDGANTQSMLLAVPGELLYRIYEEHGARLLEQNVRTYLQARGKVNQGMIATLREKPEMFFSYNNGLTATASEIIVKSESSTTVSISGIKNLQIVNGGQTTASIHFAKFKNNADLSRVFVQMKLSVVEPDLLDSIVPRIAEYANTQNKVNAADFFANHPFHRQFEQLSRTYATPRKENSLTNFGTKWYYERARGAYNNETYKLGTQKSKDAFFNEYPKSQLILKTDLAKYLMSFEGHPDVVSKGAQAAFVAHADAVGLPETFEKKRHNFNQKYYEQAIAKTIVFRELDKLIQKADWYEGGGTKACTVTYTIAWFAYELSQKKKILNFEKIWASQALMPELEEIFEELAPKIYQALKDSQPAHLSAVPQWAKRKGCWDAIKKEFNFSINEELLDAVLTTKELEKEGQRGAKQVQKQFNQEVIWSAMHRIEPDAWQSIKDFCDRHKIWNSLTPNQQRDITRLAALTPRERRRHYITEQEAENVFPVFTELNNFGFDFHAHKISSELRS